MTSSILGSALGVGIGVLLCAYALVAGQRSHPARSNGFVRYPSPDWRGFAKGAAPLGIFLIFLHWLPELASLLSVALENRSFVLNERRYKAILFVGHALAFTGITTSLLGALWATWQATRRAQRSSNEPTNGDA
jgi:hypothetical protein